jgi:hypothetical protein
MNLKLKGTITLNNDQVCIMLDHKDQIVDKLSCQCDDHQPCFPHSREVCESCFGGVEAFEDELKRQEQDERDRGDCHHDERDGYLDDGQMYYNHHEANDSWYD